MQKKIQNIGWACCLILLCFNIVLLNKAKHNNKKRIATEYKTDRHLVHDYERYLFFNTEINKYIIPDSVLNIKHENELCKRIGNTKKLFIIRYKSNNCSDCIDFVNFKLQTLPKNILNNTLLLTDFETNNQVKLKVKRIIKEDNIYNYSKINFDLDSLNIPYCFIIDSNFLVSNVFFPEKHLPLTFDFYSKNVLNNVFERNKVN